MNIIAGLGNKKLYKFAQSKTYNNNCVGIISANKYIMLSSVGNKEIIVSSSNHIEPLLPNVDCNIETNLLERFVIIIAGQAGDGKSLLASLFVRQYMIQHDNKRKIFRISMKSIEIDRNFKNFKEIVNLDIEDDLPEITNILDIPINSLFIIDDADNCKPVYKMLNMLAELGRERGISIIFITHYNSKLNDSSIYKEAQIYITFHNNMTNNRMLETHYNIDKKYIEWLKSLNQAVYMFNKQNQTIIANNFCCKLNDLIYTTEEKAEITNLLN